MKMDTLGAKIISILILLTSTLISGLSPIKVSQICTESGSKGKFIDFNIFSWARAPIAQN